MRRALVALILAGLAGCARREEAACILPTQHDGVVAELFFGRDVPNRAPVSDAEWSDFSATIIAASFPDGFTTFDGDGQWRNPATGHTSHERTKILLVAAPRSPDLARRLDRVMSAYRERFNQISVGLITTDACAAF
ncbi:MAG TPA: DUF3574 domain-containing protein [Stellaceae bacterium]|nr:DUF3574 domain-containing protein [Stellaceae bacterium]